MKKTFFILFFLVFGLQASLRAQGELKTYSFQEAEKEMRVNPKPLIVFIQTDWCKYCLGMKQFVFKNRAIIENLNDDFYFVSFDAEQKKTISFLGKTYSYKPSGVETGVHELAEKLGKVNGVLSFPSIVVLNTDFEIVFQKGEALNKAQLQEVLHHFAAE